MLKKQNCDPNRSTHVLSSNNMIDKKLHNSSLNTISSTQQSYSIKEKNNQTNIDNKKDQIFINNKKDQTKMINNKKDQTSINNNNKHKDQLNNCVQSRQKNKNSRILAEIKQSKQVMMTKRQGNRSSNISTTRSNYKPKFILKQLINQQNYHHNHRQNLNQYQHQHQQQYQQYQQSQHQQQQEYSYQRQSLCQDYYQQNHLSQQNKNTFSNTFNNSPLGSDSCYKLTKRSKPQQQPKIHNIQHEKPQKRPTFTYQHQSNVKSAILSKRTQYQPEDRTTRNTHQQNDNETLNHLNKPLQMKAFNKQKLKNNNNNNYKNNNSRGQQINNKNRTQQSLQHKDQIQQYPSEVQQYEMYYQQASTVEYPRKLFNKKGREQSQQSQSEGYEFESRLKSISSTNPCRQQQHKQMRSISINNNNKQMRSISINNNNNNENLNYKTAYLQTKKQLQIRSAYFNQAIQLCKHIIGNMKGVMEEEYAQTQSDRVMWCHQNCQDILSAFQQWTEK